MAAYIVKSSSQIALLAYMYIYEKDEGQGSVGLLRLADHRGLTVYIYIYTM